MSTILVIDDEPPIVGVLTDLLEDEGYTVVGATNGHEGLRLLERVQPDVILTDIMMPLVSGLKLCHRLKSDAARAGIPIVLMSAAANRPPPETCSYDAFLAKPFELETVLKLIQSLAA